jgi:PAS domain S-box-containing protein
MSWQPRAGDIMGDVNRNKVVKLFFACIVVIFVAEVMVMYILPAIVSNADRHLQPIADAILLSILVIPLLYLFVYRPMMFYVTRSAGFEKKLKEESLLSFIPRSSTDIAIVVADLDLVIKYYNPVAEKFFGYEAHEVIGKTVMQVHTRKNVDHSRFMEAIQIVREEGEYKYTVRQDLENGIRILESTVTGVKDRDDTLIGFMLMSRDVTERSLAEEGLKLYEHIVSLSSDLMSFLDRDLIYRAANNTYIKYFGMSREKIIGRHISDVIGRKIFENHIKDKLLRCLGGENVRFMDWYELPDGRKSFLKVSYVPFAEDNGTVSGVVVSAQDVTEKKLFEEELQRKSHDLADRVKELNCLYGISGLLESTELRLDEILQGVVNILPPSWQYPEYTCARITLNGRKYVTKAFRETRWMQSSDVIVNDCKAGLIEVYYLKDMPRKDEGPFMKEERNLIDAVSGRLGRFMERRIAQDKELIFKRYAEKVATHTGKRFMDSVVEFFSGELDFEYAFIGRLHPGNKVKTVSLYIKGAIAENIEYPLENTPCNNVVGKDVCVYDRNIQVLFPEDELLVKMNVNSYIGMPLFDSKGEPHGIVVVLGERQLKPNEGKQVSELMKIFGSRAASELESMTYQEALEDNARKLEKAVIEADAANKAKSDFLTNMSHEIRTPMNAIQGLTDLLLESTLQEEQAEHLRMLEFSSDTLLAIINDILDLSKIESNKFELDLTEFNLKYIVQNILSSLSIKAKEKGIKLDFEMADDVPDMILGDSIKLSQIIINLVNNAIKFTIEGSVRVRIALESRDDANIWLNFSVVDTGIGVPKDRIDQIFESFSQADSTISRKYGGTGLGLAISSALVKMMGGILEVNSTEGEGSEFYFTARFGVTEVSTEAVPEEQSEQAPGLDTSGRVNILLAEDNTINQKVIEKIIQKEGHNICVAANGREALDLWSRERFDMILMDVMMPEMDGYETTRAIRESERMTGEHVPIIALTAHAISEIRDDIMDAGMDDYLVKPCKSADLKKAIGKWTGRHVDGGEMMSYSETIESRGPANRRGETDEDKPVPAGTEVLIESLVKLRPHILSQRPKMCENTIKAIMGLRLPPYILPDINALNALITRFDYDKAINATDELLSRLDGQDK